MDWLIALVVTGTGFSLFLLVISGLTNRELDQEVADLQREIMDTRSEAVRFGQTVREGVSKEIGLAIDTLDAYEALTDRERDILTAVSYHYDPVEPDEKPLSGRILEQLASQELVGR